MEYKVKRFSHADYEGLDPMGRIEMRKTRNEIAKKDAYGTYATMAAKLIMSELGGH